ncbi:MAG: hypothetical protein ACO3A4_12580 [Silvanigrellaceae bacterium]
MRNDRLRQSIALVIAGVSACFPVSVAVAVENRDVDRELLLAARGAFAAKKFEDVAKIWFLKNTLADVRGNRVATEEAISSALWLAMDRLRLCPEGLPADPHGLWTLAVHNIVLRSLYSPEKESSGNPFEAFNTGFQQRKVSISDVLSAEELRALKFEPGDCSLVETMRFGGMNYSTYLRSDVEVDRPTWAGMMLDALQSARRRLKDVRGTSVVESRIFDLQLYLLEKTQGNHDLLEILNRAVKWTAADWLALSPSRRLYFFSQVDAVQPDRHRSNEIVLEIIDGLIQQKSGSDLNSWIGLYSRDKTSREYRQIWDGERGNRLLSLDYDSGFRGRSSISLRRGLASLEKGDVHNALRYLGLTINFAGRDETEAESTTALAKRWISYIAGTWKVTADLVSVLKEVLPRDAYTPVFEDLAWRAAFRGDGSSFKLAFGLLRDGSAAHGRVEQSARLSRGEVAGFANELSRRLQSEPYSAIRFCNLFLDRLESEDAAVRKRLVPVLERLTVADRIAVRKGSRTTVGLEKLSRRALEMLRVLQPQINETMVSKSRDYAPGSGIFVGNVRLAPTDTLPWPFTDPNVSPPNVFTPIVARPERWISDGQEVLGWMIVE